MLHHLRKILENSVVSVGTTLGICCLYNGSASATCLMPPGVYEYQYEQELGGVSASDVGFLDFLFGSDSDPVNYHRFQIVERSSGECLVTTEEKINVDILIDEYKSTSSRKEVWKGDKLLSFESKTSINIPSGTMVVWVKGKFVNGKTEVEVSRVKEHQRQKYFLERQSINYEVDGMVLTDSLWNPHLIQQRRVIDPRSGMCTDVKMLDAGNQADVASILTTQYTGPCGVKRLISYDSGLFNTLEVDLGAAGKLFLRKEGHLIESRDWRLWQSHRFDTGGEEACPTKDQENKAFGERPDYYYCPYSTPAKRNQRNDGR